MEPSIDDLWYYDLPSPSSPPSEPLPPPLIIPRSNPDRAFCNLEADDKNPRMQYLHRAFDAMDADHDGELSCSELCVWMKKLGLEFAEDGITRLIDRSDARRCRSLDFKEFALLSEAGEERGDEERTCTADERKAAHQAVLADVFELFDKDHNGLISPKELSETLESLGLRKTQGNDSQCVEMIKRVDLDGDGQVSFAEFQHMMAQEDIDLL